MDAVPEQGRRCQCGTYTLEVGPSTTGQGPYNTRLLQSMGSQGKGGYYSAIDAATLLAALTRIINDIQAVNSVFASASLPLSADNSGAMPTRCIRAYSGRMVVDGRGGQPQAVQIRRRHQPGLVSGGFCGSAGCRFVRLRAARRDQLLDEEGRYGTSRRADDRDTGRYGRLLVLRRERLGRPLRFAGRRMGEKGGAAQQLRLAYLGYSSVKGINDATSPRKVYTCTGGCLTGTGAAVRHAVRYQQHRYHRRCARYGQRDRDLITSASSLTNVSVAGTGIAIFR